jgi:hypothetical protein
MKRCFIIGKGRSLKGFDLNRLKDEYTLCLNHSVFVTPNPSGLCFLDSNFYPAYKEFIDNFKGDVHTISSSGYPGAEDNLMGYSLTGVFALAKAVERFDIVYLLGYDLDNEFVYPYFTDFDNDILTERQWNKDKYSFYHDPCFTRPKLEMFDREFVQYKDRVFNCNPNSAVKTFPFTDIEEVLK